MVENQTHQDQLIDSMSIQKENAADITQDKVNCTSNSNDVNSLRLKLFYADELVHVGQEFIKKLNHYDRKKSNDVKGQELSQDLDNYCVTNAIIFRDMKKQHKRRMPKTKNES